MADFQLYMLSEPRNLLSQSSNDGTSQNPDPRHPMPEDAGNWTGCSRNSGNLVGTYRDISACMLTSVLGRPATEADLLALTFQDVSNYFRAIWDGIGAGPLPDQDLANLYMHIKLHFGNIHVAQQGLNDLGENLSVDGVAGPLTRAAILRQANRNAVATYNSIRLRLKANYENSNPIFRNGFMRIVEEWFPAKEPVTAPIAKAGGALIGAGILGLLAYVAVKNR